MKKKGFTLIELLAVIVVLAVIALITVPTILGVIEKARRSSLQDSGYGLLEAANLYYAQYQNSKTVRFDIENNKITTEEENELKYKGNVKKGTVLINNKGKVTVCINDGKHAAYKNYQDTKVTIVDSKTCTIPENDYIVYLDGESTIKEMSNQELTDAVKNLVNQVNQLKQENEQLKQQINNKSDQSQATNIQVKHDQDVTSIWNKVGKEDISSIGTNISSTLIDQNNKLTNLQDLVNGKVDATVTNNLSNQISSLDSSINILKNNFSSIGEKYESTNDKKVALNNGVMTNLCSVTVPAGSYVGYAQMRVNFSATSIQSMNVFKVVHPWGEANDWKLSSWTAVYSTIPVVFTSSSSSTITASAYISSQEDTSKGKNTTTCKIVLMKLK